MEFYRTKQGDTWDKIAYQVYGDEMKADVLMDNNPDLLDIFVFNAGTIVYIPTLEEEEDTEDAPDWRDEE